VDLEGLTGCSAGERGEEPAPCRTTTGRISARVAEYLPCCPISWAIGVARWRLSSR